MQVEYLGTESEGKVGGNGVNQSWCLLRAGLGVAGTAPVTTGLLTYRRPESHGRFKSMDPGSSSETLTEQFAVGCVNVCF